MNRDNSDSGATSTDLYYDLVSNLRVLLDLDGGLNEALQHVRYERLVEALTDTLGVEAGLAEALHLITADGTTSSEPSDAIDLTLQSGDCQDAVPSRPFLPRPRSGHDAASNARRETNKLRHDVMVTFRTIRDDDTANNLMFAANGLVALEKGITGRTIDRKQARRVIDGCKKFLLHALSASRRTGLDGRYFAHRIKNHIEQLRALESVIEWIFDDSDTHSPVELR